MMSDKYEIVRTPTEIVVIALSYESPLDMLDAISIDLREISLDTSVIFDLLLCNGESSNRFVQGIFQNGKFVRDRFSVTSDVHHNISQNTRNFFIINTEYLKNGVLSNEEQRFILTGDI